MKNGGIFLIFTLKVARNTILPTVPNIPYLTTVYGYVADHAGGHPGTNHGTPM